MTTVQGIDVHKLHETGAKEKQWRFHYNGITYHIFESSRGKFVTDENDERVTSGASSLREAVEHTMDARPHPGLASRRDTYRERFASGEPEEIRLALREIRQDPHLPERTRQNLQWVGEDAAVRAERRQQFGARKREVNGMQLTTVDVELTSDGNWAEAVQQYMVFDQTNTHYILLDTSQRSPKQLEGELENYGLVSLFEWDAMTPRERHNGQYEGFDDRSGILWIEKSAISGEMRLSAGDSRQLNVKRPRRIAEGAYMTQQPPAEHEIHNHIERGRALIRGEIHEEFERLKAHKYDLACADGQV